MYGSDDKWVCQAYKSDNKWVIPPRVSALESRGIAKVTSKSGKDRVSLLIYHGLCLCRVEFALRGIHSNVQVDVAANAGTLFP